MTDSRNPLTRQRSKWEADDSPEVAEFLRDAGSLTVNIWNRNVNDGILRAVVAEEPGGWHMSISHNRRTRAGGFELGRYPTWDEIADARYTLLPDTCDFVMHLPPPSEYVAVHDTTFHLHEHPARDE